MVTYILKFRIDDFPTPNPKPSVCRFTNESRNTNDITDFTNDDDWCCWYSTVPVTGMYGNMCMEMALVTTEKGTSTAQLRPVLRIVPNTVTTTTKIVLPILQQSQTQCRLFPYFQKRKKGAKKHHDMNASTHAPTASVTVVTKWEYM